MPYRSRPRDWKRGSRKTPSLGGMEEVTYNATHSVSPAEHPPCPKCGVKTLFDHNLGAYFCPRCGLELQNE